MAPSADLFAVLGVPRQLAVDAARLEQQYHAAARVVHPDRFQAGDPRARTVSVETSAQMNRAYRVLRDPVARGRYWLELHGRRLAERGGTVPPEVAAEVFETQERLAEFRAATPAERAALESGVREVGARLAARLEALRGALVERYAEWNGAAGALDELARRLAEIAYLSTLAGDIEDAVGEGRGTHHRH